MESDELCFEYIMATEKSLVLSIAVTNLRGRLVLPSNGHHTTSNEGVLLVESCHLRRVGNATRIVHRSISFSIMTSSTDDALLIVLRDPPLEFLIDLCRHLRISSKCKEAVPVRKMQEVVA